MDSHPMHDSSTAQVHLSHGLTTLTGALTIPARPRGVVLIVDGVGDDRHSPINRFVAAWLQGAGLATLQLNLLTAHEAWASEKTPLQPFGSERLTGRLVAATSWLARDPRTAGLAIAYFGAGAGAGVAMAAAAQRADQVDAVVWCAGRPDLAGGVLGLVRAPTLLLVDEVDITLQVLNQHAMRQMHADVQLTLVAGMMPPINDPEALRRLARLSLAWFEQNLPATSLGFGAGWAASEGASAARAPESIR